MAINSINTNAAAIEGLAALNTASKQVVDSQQQISTGLKVASAKDDGATWSIAQSMKSKIADLQVVSDSLNRGQSILDVAAQGATQIGDILNQLKAKALSYSDTSLDATSRASLQTDMTSLIHQIDQIANNADFNGVNILNSSSSSAVPMTQVAGSPWSYVANTGNVPGTINASILATGTADLFYDGGWSGLQVLGASPTAQTVSATRSMSSSFPYSPSFDLFGSATVLSATFVPSGASVGPSQVSILSNPDGQKYSMNRFNLTSSGMGMSNLDWSNAQSLISAISSASQEADSASMNIGNYQNTISSLQREASSQATQLQTGVSNLVDANMGTESAKLTAAQSKQQLAAKALSIANITPQWILSLFR
jgi:flagellin